MEIRTSRPRTTRRTRCTTRSSSPDRPPSGGTPQHGVDHRPGQVRDRRATTGGTHAAVRAAIATVPQPVLYAPTWRGHVEETSCTPCPSGERIVSALLRPRADGDLPAAPVQLRLRRRRGHHRAHPSRCWPPTQARTGRPHLFGAAAENELGDRRLHQRLRRDGVRRVQRGLGLPVLAVKPIRDGRRTRPIPSSSLEELSDRAGWLRHRRLTWPASRRRWPPC